MSLEADVAYLHLIDGIRQSEVPPGFSVHSAPRKAARGRDRDVLLIGLYLNGPGPKDLAEAVVSSYFGTPGSVTAAARATLLAASAQLFDYNRYPPASGPVTGGLCLAVLRGVDFYVAAIGAGQVTVVHPAAVEHFPDAAAEPAVPFGLEKLAEVQYFHTQVAAADYALLTGSLPIGWEPNGLSHLPGAGLESAIARLTRLAGANAQALIAHFTADDPQVAPARGRPSITAAPLQTATPAPAVTAASPTPIAPPVVAQVADAPHHISASPDSLIAPAPIQAPPMETSGLEGDTPADGSALAGIIARVRASPVLSESEEEAPPVIAAAGAAPAAAPPEGVVQIGDHVYEFEESENSETGSEPADEAEQVSLAERVRNGLRSLVARLPLIRAGDAVKQGSETIGASVSGSSNAMLRRVLPEGTLRPDTPMRIPDRALMAIAILLPVIIAIAVGVIYIQRGRNQQYQTYLENARLEAGLARTAADPLSAKPHWQTALRWLDQADRVFPGQPDSAALRPEAQAAVDQVDNVQRLNLAALVPGGFSGSAQITQIVVHGTEVYALDSVRQAVYRSVFTESDKFVIDRNFQCQLGVVGAVTIKQIVDIVWLDTPNIVGQPALLALDADGDLMYCKTDGSAPEATTLIAPDTGFKTLRAAEIYADRLYVFDPGSNDIWAYDRVGGVFSERPKSYFTGQVLDLSNAINFTIAQGEVYILRNDGRLTYCVRDLTTLQTNCLESSLYSDSRPGHASGDRLDDLAGPLALFYDPPPEPSLYLLDTASNGVYQLSLKLVLQKVYRSLTPLPGPVTALAIGPNKEVFVASGNNVYWAQR